MDRLAGTDSTIVRALIQRALETCHQPKGQERLLLAADCLVRDYLEETDYDAPWKPGVTGEDAERLFLRYYDGPMPGIGAHRGVEVPDVFTEHEFTRTTLRETARIMRRMDDAALKFFQSVATPPVTQ